MAREVDLISYLPSVLEEIKELVEIANVENPIINALWKEIENALNNQFVLTVNEDKNGATRYEKMLELKIPATDTIETRRFRILTRYQEQVPYSYKVLKQLLNSLLGENHYDLERNVAEKWLDVKIELTVKGQFDTVQLLLERITPQNMLLTVGLRYNQHIFFTKYTHGQMRSLTHDLLRSEVLN
ncbi:putative phage tail protein [Sporosarcina sp. FSL K6-1508]|uniref:putative phage tail protein n=1 Tax=Sporosarcina sp. FSL K6-1508 TaxID=2921553 RepID=UPI0030F5B044